MLSKRTSGWKLRDWFLLFLGLAFLVPLFVAIVHGVAPSSGLANAMHQGGHTVSNFLLWISAGLTTIANWFNQL
jgi:hypothetical protein